MRVMLCVVLASLSCKAGVALTRVEPRCMVVETGVTSNALTNVLGMQSLEALLTT